MDAVAGTKPAAAPVPAKPAAPLPSRPEPALADVANPGAGPSAPPVAMPKAAAPPKAPVASNTPAANKAFGGLGQGLGGAKHGPGKTDSEGVDLGDNRVAKGSGSLPPLMNGTDFAATDNSPSAGGAAAVNGKRGQARSNRFAGSKAAVAIHVRLDVSALAVQNKVFENLLADNGLGNDQNSKNYARRALKSDGYLQSRITTAGPLRESPAKDSSGHGNGQGDRVGGLPQQVPDNTLQESIGTSSQQDAQFALATSSKPMIYEFDASPEQLAIVIGQIRKRSESFWRPRLRRIMATASSITAVELAAEDWPIVWKSNSKPRPMSKPRPPALVFPARKQRSPKLASRRPEFGQPINLPCRRTSGFPA